MNPLSRSVESEWLDHLPPDDPRAIGSRRDLRRVNVLMLHATVMSRAIKQHWQGDAPRTLLDLGAGDGTFAWRVARRLASRWKNVSVTLLDRQDIVSSSTRERFSAIGWTVETVQSDVLEYLENPRHGADIITATLFLHHFTSEPLTRLLAGASRLATLFVACEPRRSASGLFGSRLLWMIGGNDVTLHDSHVSVRAGFTDQELSALWPADPGWRLHEGAAGLFSHCFVAGRSQDVHRDA